MNETSIYAAQFSRHNQQRRAPPQREFSAISGETFERCRTIRRAASVAAGTSLRMLAASAFTKRMLPGGRWDRPELHKALEHLRRGGVLICWKLDRLSRSLSDLLRILQKVDQAGAKFKSLTDELDTTTPMGRMVMQVVGSFAEFERSRTKLGLARARANGRVGGGRYKLSASQQAEAIKMIRVGEKSQAEIAELFNVDRSTISRMMKEVREKDLLKALR